MGQLFFWVEFSRTTELKKSFCQFSALLHAYNQSVIIDSLQIPSLRTQWHDVSGFLCIASDKALKGSLYSRSRWVDG